MVVHDRDTLSNMILHFGPSFCGTRQFWQKQRRAMDDTLGLPTAFFTLSAADLQQPELAHLLHVEEPLSSSARSTAVFENPCLADWFFYHHVVKFMDVFYMVLWEPRTTGCALSTDTEVVHMFMELYGYKMLPM